MESNGYSHPLDAPATNDAPMSYTQNGGRQHPFTVDEALAYSPMASVIPFNTGIIPLPNIGERLSASIYPTPHAEKTARQYIDNLSQPTSTSDGTEQKLGRALGELQRLLKPSSLTQISFKSGPQITNLTSGSSTPMAAPKLSSFAQAVLSSTNVPYYSQQTAIRRAQSLKENSRIQQNGQTPLQLKEKRPLKIALTQQGPARMEKSAQAQARAQPGTNGTQQPQAANLKSRIGLGDISSSPSKNEAWQTKVEVCETKPLTPPQHPDSDALQTPKSGSFLAVEIPMASAVIRREEYITIPASERDGANDDMLEGHDQRQQADETFQALQRCMSSIFASEDNPEGDRSACAIIGEDVLSITSPVLSNCQILLHKIISLGRFSQVPVEDLIRLQKLLDGSTRAAGTINLRFEESWNDSDLNEYLGNVHVANIGLRSARTALRIMSGGREDKQLYSEELIQAAVASLNNVLDSCIVPTVELRASGSTGNIFKLLVSKKKVLKDVLLQSQRLLTMLRDLVSKIELSEAVINSLEYTVSRLIFVENATSEKDSVLGVAKFDNLRVVAMDTLAQIFSSHVEQRNSIIAEILTSLEKLPVTKQSARQFKLASGGSIQLVSALLMRLIQTSADKTDAKSRRRGSLDDDAEGDPDDDAVPSFQIVIGGGPLPSAYDTESRALENPQVAVQDLEAIAHPLLETAKASASYVVSFIVQRAGNSTKSGDAPYRNLLDLFVQDFITCLGSSDWPAAELLLRMFVIHMINLAENEKTAGTAKNMALEFLAEVGAAISKLSAHVRKLAATLEADSANDEVSSNLLHLVELFNEDKLNIDDMSTWNGPYHISLSHLDSRYAADFTLQSAVGYCTADWASHICIGYQAIADSEDSDQEQHMQEYGRLAYRLRMMINDKKWLSTEMSSRSPAETTAELAYALTILFSPLSRAFNRILMILLNSTDSEQAMVRSKGLKSFILLLDTDPTILDRGKNVIRIVLSRSNDPSIAVRDAALGLIEKCIAHRPALESESLPAIMRASGDSSTPVRKRAIKLLRDVYLRNQNKDVRTSIADALLHRAKDPDDKVQELARQIIEEVWMAPFYGHNPSENDSVQYRLSVADHVGLMVKTVQRSPEVSAVLDKVLQSSLAKASPNSAKNFKVCKTFVGTMFDTIIGGPGLGATNKLDAKDALQLLMTFAKASPKLFTTDQIQLLEPYITDVKTENDIAIFRPVIVIFRHVFPELSTLHTAFLTSVRSTMMRTITRMNRAILDDIFACLRIMSEVLENNNPLVALMGSTIDPIRKLTKTDLSDPKQENNVKKIIRLFLITGMCGKHCDLDNQISVFQQKFPDWKKGTSVSQLMVDSFAPFASPSQPLEIRRAALDAIGLVCQTWPKNYQSASIYTAFQAAFEDKVEALESVILRSFKEFFYAEESRSEPGAEPSVGGAGDTPATLGVMGGSMHDGVSSFLHQQFMKYITEIALSSDGEHALLATEVLTSISRQGLGHPKEVAPTFVALETSTHPKIADLAYRAHEPIHLKWETIMEKEYMRAVQTAFIYQQKVVKDTRGAVAAEQGSSHTSKMHLLYDLMTKSKPKMRNRFYESLCSRVDFDPQKLDAEGNLPNHVEFSRFVIENLTFFEYTTVDDLLTTISAMEKIVAGTGTSVAHALETEIFSFGIEDLMKGVAEEGQPAPASKSVDPPRLRQLTAAAMILSCLWEARTHLRRQYGLMNKDVGGRKETKAKVNVKDLNKAPTKAPFTNGDKFWEDSTRIMGSLESQESMMDQCRSFVELLTVDKDFKIAAEGEDDIAARARLTTPDLDDDEERSQPPSGSGRSRKRKAAGTPSGRKKRARSNSKSRSKKMRGSSGDSDDDDYDG